MILADARKKAADATLEAAAADLNKANKEAVVKNQAYEPYNIARKNFLSIFYPDQKIPDDAIFPSYEEFINKIIELNPEASIQDNFSFFLSFLES